MKKSEGQRLNWIGLLQQAVLLMMGICLITLLSACTSTRSLSSDTLAERALTKQSCLAAALPANPDLFAAPEVMPIYLLSERPLSNADQLTFTKWLLTDYAVNTRKLLLWQAHSRAVPTRIDLRLMTLEESKKNANE